MERKDDKFYHSVVEAMPAKGEGNYIRVGTFDEFGMAEGEPSEKLGPLSAIRIRVTKDSKYWVILSEVSLDVLPPRHALFPQRRHTKSKHDQKNLDRHRYTSHGTPVVSLSCPQMIQTLLILVWGLPTPSK